MTETKISETPSIGIKHAKILRGPHQIAFDLTYKCNFRCLHCYNLSGENILNRNELKDNEVVSFIKDVSKLQPYNFCFCGGEPLLREKILYESAKILADNGIIVSLVTNGSLVTRERAKKLKESGVKNVQVSLDGARAETHEMLRQYKNAFNLAVNAIRYFIEENYEEVSIAFIPTRFNYLEIEDTFYLCKELGVDKVNVQPLMLLGRTRLNSDIIPTPLQYRWLVKKINEIQRKYKEPIIQWGDPVDHLIRFRTLTQHCINFVTVRANGDIAVSPYLQLTVGNIKRHSLKEYWDAGLPRIWELPIVKEFAKQINSVVEFNKSSVWFERNIEIDIIDDHLFEEKEVKNE